MEFISEIPQFLLFVLTFVLIFSLLIILHELGHFWAARWAGIRVEEFGFGLPPKIWGKKTSRTVTIMGKNGRKKKVKEEMEWTLNAIPFGGFVRMLGEESDAECKDDLQAFCNRPLFSRIVVVLAGVAMNFLLAFVLFFIVTLTGFDPLIDPNLSDDSRFTGYFEDNHVDAWVEQGFYEYKTNGTFVAAVDPDSPAGMSGIESGDQIISINETTITTPEQLQEIQQNSPADTPLTYSILRISEKNDTAVELTKTITPTEKDGSKVIGVLITDHFYYRQKDIRLSFSQALRESAASCKRLIKLSAGMVKTVFGSIFGKILHFEKPEIPNDIGGPVAIASTTKQLVEVGDISKIIQFAAILSLSLAVINLVPFPALDGGRLFFLLLEFLLMICIWPLKQLFPKAKLSHRIPAKFEMPFHVAGYALLLLFIVVITFKDIGRIFMQ
jgi:regulator of sigma E protease